ncbi:unnamed protein product [Schistocephalus solidus]|uniref:Secreted protein n=1 Tax=Schistocephalus solidus TaxID=70667 RepID=A0A183SAL5_SCHSO|nr:unnamed protein product [Schistocephalus solidus]
MLAFHWRVLVLSSSLLSDLVQVAEDAEFPSPMEASNCFSPEYQDNQSLFGSLLDILGTSPSPVADLHSTLLSFLCQQVDSLFLSPLLPIIPSESLA